MSNKNCKNNNCIDSLKIQKNIIKKEFENCVNYQINFFFFNDIKNHYRFNFSKWI